MIGQRRQMSRNAHRVGFGRVNQRLRKAPLVNCPPAPIGHNAMPGGNSEPEWLKERPMSDDWTNNQQHTEWQNPEPQPHQDHGYQDPNHGNQFQTEQQTFQPHIEQPVFEADHQHAEPAHEPVVEAVAAAPSPEMLRLDAIEASINELRAHMEELKASLHAPHAAEAEVTAEAAPVVEAEEAAVVEQVEAEHVEEAAAEAPAEAVAEAVVDHHAERLAAIETEIAEVKSLISKLYDTTAALHEDVKSNAARHAETQSIVDDQLQLSRGLNYIITSAIGTLTASAKSMK